jgi:hypothetical protein
VIRIPWTAKVNDRVTTKKEAVRKVRYCPGKKGHLNEFKSKISHKNMKEYFQWEKQNETDLKPMA